MSSKNVCQNIFDILPDLVVDKLLSYLDFHSHLKLRISCKTTQSWVETPRFLKLLQYHPDDLYVITKNFIPVTRLHVECADKHPSLDLDGNVSIFQKCLESVGSTLKSLHLSKFNGSRSQLEALGSLHCLSTLSIGILDLSTNSHECWKDNSTQFDNFTQVLKSLRHFSTSKILIRYPASTELGYYGSLLGSLCSLKSLNVPIVEEYEGRKIDQNILLSINYGFVIGPIIKYITKRAYQPLEDSEGQNLQSLDLSGFEIAYFEIFPELVRLCNKTGTFLDQVDYPLVRKLVAMRYDPKLLKVVRSLRNRLVGNANTFRELKNVRKIQLDLGSCGVYIPKEIDTQKDILFPELKILEVNCWSENNDDGTKDVENVARILFSCGGSKSLRELVLTCSPTNSALILLPVPEIVCRSRVHNLTVLKVKNFLKFTNEDFIAVMRNLRKLECLEIDDEWGGITDEGICSRDEDRILDIFKLQDLKKLKIKCRCKYTGAFYPNGQAYMWPWSKLKKFSNSANKHYMSDFSFKEVFCHLRLQSFLVESADIHVTKLGYYSLLSGQFAECIEYFPCPEYLPTGLTSDDFYMFRTNFRHFQTPQKYKNYYTFAKFHQDPAASNCVIF